MGACATKPKVSKSDKDAVDAPVPAPEEVVAGVDSEMTAEVKKEEEVVVAAGAEQGESVKEVVGVEGGNKPRSLSLLLEEVNDLVSVYKTLPLIILAAFSLSFPI